MALQLPARIGKYDLEEFLGGGMSHVYRARDTVIGRTVAVKILTEAGCADVEAKTRFLQEARMAGNLQHENVLSIYDFGEDEQQRPYMVMEFLRGEDLRHAIRNNHVGDLCTKLRIALQVARAIGFIHTQKIVHRDIKPENIHLTQNGVVKLMDFGIAKTEGFSMTRTGYVMGTPYYMAPEQVLGKNIGEKVDIYAFGVLFFELLAGIRPISGETVERIFYSILNEPLNLEPLEQGGVPTAIRELIAQCTAKDPSQRPENFEAVAAVIERTLGQLEAPAATLAAPPAPVEAPAPYTEPVPAAMQRWVAVVLGVGLLAAIVVLVVLFMRPHANKEAAKQPPPAPLSPTLSLPSGDMVLVPAGEFLFGKKPEPATLPAFYIDRTEVANAAYQSFCQATGHALPADFAADKPDYPVVNVTLDDARQFAKWAQKRLPSTREWEKAARGTAGWLYPWGNEKEPSRANVKDSPLSKHAPMPVAGFENGASPFGALQIIGNVWEFVDDQIPPAHIRGQSFQEALDPTVMYDSTTLPIDAKYPTVGFRCVKDAPVR